MRPVYYGMARWCDLFTPRQLLGHLTLVEELNRLKPEILRELGLERGRAVVTYLQFMIDKCVDYNSKQTRWIPQRAIVSGTFGRHDFSLKWTFGEMIFTGPNSGAAWGLSQVADAYKGMAELMTPLHDKLGGTAPPVTIRCSTAANMDLSDNSADLVCIDPPYYNNVQYAELSDYFYVWQRRTLHDLYPGIFRRRLTNKTDEAVANPARDGSATGATQEYERLMGEIFAECCRILKDNGIMTIMFTHKTQEAWEALTRSLVEAGWMITSSFPVESEFKNSQHIMENASAASSIFLTCRKREATGNTPATWTGFGGAGVALRVREAVREGLKEFEPLKLNAVDEMVASYGRALRVLSENWPVLDGDEPVSPIRAMNEAGAVVAQSQVARLTQGRLQVEDLDPEAAMALTLYGIFRLGRHTLRPGAEPLARAERQPGRQGRRVHRRRPDDRHQRRKPGQTLRSRQRRGYRLPCAIASPWFKAAPGPAGGARLKTDRQSTDGVGYSPRPDPGLPGRRYTRCPRLPGAARSSAGAGGPRPAFRLGGGNVR